jgi:hypothetical protein
MLTACVRAELPDNSDGSRKIRHDDKDGCYIQVRAATSNCLSVFIDLLLLCNAWAILSQPPFCPSRRETCSHS